MPPAVVDRLRGMERGLVASVLRRLPLAVTRRLKGVLQRRYVGPGTSIVRGRMRHGQELLLDLRSPVQTTAFFSGRYDADLVDLAVRLLDRPGAVALDLGANIGLWTVPLAARAARIGGRVVAVEPVAANRARLRENLELNGLSEYCDLVPAAVSDHVGSLQLSLRGDFVHGATTGNAAVTIRDGGDAGLRHAQADVVRVDDLGLADGGTTLRVVKIDVEGHEDRTLRGARHVLATSRPTTIAEWNAVYYQRREVDPTLSVEEVLGAARYAVLRRTRSGWRRQPGFSSPKELDNLLLVPREDTGSLLQMVNASPRAA